MADRRILFLLVSSLAACGDAVGPDQPEGTLLARGSLAFEWSADGREIFYYDTTSRLRPVPDRILAVNVITKATRVVVSSGAYGFAGVLRPGMPPRVTIAGLAYLGVDTEQFALHLVTDATDVALAACGSWFAATPDRSRLLYSPAVWMPFDDSIKVIDLVTTTRTSVPTGPYHATSGTVISPDGNRLLVERTDAERGFGILNLTTGTITALHDSLFPGVPFFWPIPLGWNGDGVWFVVYGGPAHLVRYDPASGDGQAFPIVNSLGGTRAVTGGAALPMGNAVVWSQNCNATDPLSGICTSGAYSIWLMNPLTAVDDLLVSFDAMPDFDYPRAFFAAASPDGQSLAYVLGNELRLLALR